MGPNDWDQKEEASMSAKETPFSWDVRQKRSDTVQERSQELGPAGS